MKHSSISNIALLSFSCALAIFIFLQDIALRWVNSNEDLVAWGAIAIIFISAMQIYERIFEFFLWLYSTYFYKVFDKRLDMSGKWYQVFIINEISEKTISVRFGDCTIVSNLDTLLISGENYRHDGSFSSSWQSDVATIAGDHIVLLYSSEGAKRNIARGTMKFHFSGFPPDKLVGNFADVAPATHSGHITLFRNESDYKARLKALGIISPAHEEIP